MKGLYVITILLFFLGITAQASGWSIDGHLGNSSGQVTCYFRGFSASPMEIGVAQRPKNGVVLVHGSFARVLYVYPCYERTIVSKRAVDIIYRVGAGYGYTPETWAVDPLKGFVLVGDLGIVAGDPALRLGLHLGVRAFNEGRNLDFLWPSIMLELRYYMLNTLMLKVGSGIPEFFHVGVGVFF